MSFRFRHRCRHHWNGLSYASMTIFGVISATTLFTMSHAQSPSSPPATDPTFTRDVLPILQGHCQVCHRPGQIAPMAFTSYEEVRPWAKAIAKAVYSRTMPPFPAAGPLGHFQNDPRLSEEQIAAIVKWVDLGSPRGDPTDAPPPRAWPDSPWLMEDPDLVVDFPVFTPNTENKDEFVYFYTDYVFPQETWIQSIEFRPTHRNLAHHAGIFATKANVVIPDDLTISSERISEEALNSLNLSILAHNNLYTWLPGSGLESRPLGQGLRIEKGATLIVQVHFAPTLEPVASSVSLAFKFVDGRITESRQIVLSLMMGLIVPPGEESYIYRQTVAIPNNARVIGYWAHMHLRGKSMSIIFHEMQGKSERVFNIPRWDFDWQHTYTLTEPIYVANKTRVEFVGEWDNSANNPLNPDPTQTVRWGPNTSDEMFGGAVFYTQELETPIIIRNGIEVIGPQEFQR